MIWSRLIACLLQKTNHPDRNLSVMADFFRYSWILQRGERVFNLGVDTKKGWNLKLFNDILLGSFGKISGHGITLGGIIVNSGNFGWKASGKTTPIEKNTPSYHGDSFVEAAAPAAFVTYIHAILLRDKGATLSHFNAFLFL